jgi:hypothetical protein
MNPIEIRKATVADLEMLQIKYSNLYRNFAVTNTQKILLITSIKASILNN